MPHSLRSWLAASAAAQSTAAFPVSGSPAPRQRRLGLYAAPPAAATAAATALSTCTAAAAAATAATLSTGLRAAGTAAAAAATAATLSTGPCAGFSRRRNRRAIYPPQCIRQQVPRATPPAYRRAAPPGYPPAPYRPPLRQVSRRLAAVPGWLRTGKQPPAPRRRQAVPASLRGTAAGPAPNPARRAAAIAKSGAYQRTTHRQRKQGRAARNLRAHRRLSRRRHDGLYFRFARYRPRARSLTTDAPLPTENVFSFVPPARRLRFRVRRCDRALSRLLPPGLVISAGSFATTIPSLHAKSKQPETGDYVFRVSQLTPSSVPSSIGTLPQVRVPRRRRRVWPHTSPEPEPGRGRRAARIRQSGSASFWASGTISGSATNGAWALSGASPTERRTAPTA